jgi:hypothetical protein
VQGYDEVRIQIDRLGQPIGAVVIHDRHGAESVRPIDPGPFDSPGEVLDYCIKHFLTIQQTLWSDRT